METTQNRGGGGRGGVVPGIPTVGICILGHVHTEPNSTMGPEGQPGAKTQVPGCSGQSELWGLRISWRWGSSSQDLCQPLHAFNVLGNWVADAFQAIADDQPMIRYVPHVLRHTFHMASRSPSCRIARPSIRPSLTLTLTLTLTLIQTPAPIPMRIRRRILTLLQAVQGLVHVLRRLISLGQKPTGASGVWGISLKASFTFDGCRTGPSRYEGSTACPSA